MKRIIPCLDVRDGRVVKGVNFVELRDAGDPVELASRYDAEGADELVFLDITASHERREIITELAARSAEEVFIPFTIGGERVAGSGEEGRPPAWEVYVHGGRTPTGIDALAWAVRAAELGAGEFMLTSMDRDGTRDGYDLELTRAVARAVDIPVIASGGVGTLEHLADGLTAGEADAVLAASIFHFGTYSIAETKEYLAAKGIPVRIVAGTPPAAGPGAAGGAAAG